MDSMRKEREGLRRAKKRDKKNEIGDKAEKSQRGERKEANKGEEGGKGKKRKRKEGVVQGTGTHKRILIGGSSQTQTSQGKDVKCDGNGEKWWAL